MNAEQTFRESADVLRWLNLAPGIPQTIEARESLLLAVFGQRVLAPKAVQ